MIGFDFLLHGGILAKLYLEPSPFLLPPERAFAFIPLGYASFLITASLLAWLSVRLEIRGSRSGFLFGLKLGAMIWAAWILGLLSISTASLSLLIGWFIGQTVEFGIGGLVIGSSLASKRLVKPLLWILVFCAVCIIMTIILQSLGIAPSLHGA
jgi:hypothetical protein